MTSRASRRKSSWSSVNADCTSAPSGDGLAFLATARGRQARTQGGSIWVYIGPTEDAAWRARAPPEAHCLLPDGVLTVQSDARDAAAAALPTGRFSRPP